MQEEDIDMIFGIAEEGMNHAIDHLQKELVKIRTGKASPAMLGGLYVSYYGSPTPLNQVSNVSTSDARTLVIQPWEKSMLGPIEKSIFEANLGVTPQNNGEIIIINIPPLTEERRIKLGKDAKALGEDSKVSIRNVRRDAITEFKNAVKDGFPEDIGKRKEKEVEDLTKKYIDKIDAMVAAKEKDIMTI